MIVMGLELLHRLVRYEPETGKLFWKPRTPEMFKSGSVSSESICDLWNKNFAGAEALNADHGDGYKHGSLMGKKCLAHRVVWFLHHGSWPDDQVDHINGDRSDNRIENLRAVSNLVNGRNRRKSVRNSSGITGVYWCPEQSKWRASICVDGKLKHLGRFDTIEAAASARKRAEMVNSFHPNHGSAAV